ncbi:MAG: AI-2E family transporter [Eubacteriales bacterium]|nr:AI-2E family transporter [Eubacteriales bacterium]
MKIRFDHKALKICLLVFLTAAAVLVFNKMLNSSENLLNSLGVGWRALSRVLSPFLFAVSAAYILNPAVNAIEKGIKFLWRGSKGANVRHTLSVVLVYLLLAGLFTVLIYFTIPQMVSNIVEIGKEMPDYYNWAKTKLTQLTVDYPFLQSPAVTAAFEKRLALIQNNMLGYLEKILSGVAGAVGSVIGTVINIVLGVVLSFYLLNEKASIAGSLKRLCIARLGEVRSTKVFGALHDADNVFGRYLSSKLLESVVLYAAAQIVLSVMGVKFNVLFSVLVALTNLIPYIGPVIGAVPPILVTLMIDPLLALYVGIALLVLQIIDAYVIAPVLTGNNTGLSPFWVMFATLLGGNLFGLAGMLLAVPVCGVAALFLRRYVGHKLLAMEERTMQAGKTASEKA